MRKIILIIIAMMLLCVISLNACASEQTDAEDAAGAESEEQTETAGQAEEDPAAEKPAEEDEDTITDGLTVTFVDVGKGDCILVGIDGKYVLIDAGYTETASEVISYFKDLGIERLDYLIITHYDKDHVGGAVSIVKEFEIGQIYLPDYEGASKYYTAFKNTLGQYGLNAERLSETTSFSISGAEFTIYPSDIPYVHEIWQEEGNDNDVSFVISLLYGEDSYMLAGDLEEEGIDRYLAAGRGQFDVLKVPHHGVKEKNSDELIEDVKPQIAVITDGPKDEADKKVLKKLTKAGADIYQTSECGTIVITSNGTGEYEVTTQK